MISITRPSKSLPRLATLGGTMDVLQPVQLLIMSHDERWYPQAPAIISQGQRGPFWICEVVLGNEEPLEGLTEYVAVAVTGIPPIKKDVLESLNELPFEAELSAPVSVQRAL